MLHHTTDPTERARSIAEHEGMKVHRANGHYGEYPNVEIRIESAALRELLGATEPEPTESPPPTQSR